MPHWQSEFAGPLAAGVVGPNGATQLPEIKNRSISVGQLNQIRYDYDLTDVGHDDHKTIIYLDGSQDGTGDDTNGYQTTPVAATGHDLESMIMDAQDAPPAFLSGSASGRRVRLSWPRSASTDLAAYKIYWDEGDGVATDVVLATIDTVQASSVVAVSGGSGGTGTLLGVYRGPVVNAVWDVEIISVANRTARFRINSGSWIAFDFEPQQMFNLQNGLRWRWDYVASAYSNGDAWQFTVGAATSFVTDELDEGTYLFALSGVDQAGNESTKSVNVSVTVTHEVDAPANLAVTYDGDDFVATWSVASGATGTRIYTNYDPAFGVLRDYVLELNPIATVTAPTATATITAAGLNGVAMFYARSYDAGGEEDNCNLVTLDVGSLVSSTVAAPFELVGTAGAAGVAVLSWAYTPNDVTPDLFRVYEFTSAPDLATINAASPLATVSYTAGAVYQEFTFTTSALAGQRWYVVRAVDGDGVEEQNTTVVSVTPDSTAPTIGSLSAEVIV